MAAPIDLISLATVKLAALDQSGSRYPATGFLFRRDDKVYLITNWHVLTGRPPAQRQHSLTGSLVTHLEITFHWSSDQKYVAPYKSVKNTYEVLEVATMKGAWIEHTDPEVDVVLLPIELPPDCYGSGLERVSFDERYEPAVGEDVFVVGFPENLGAGTTTLPLWKGGTIASEPAGPINRKPRHLIDCDTYEGMSGSSVIARRQSGLFHKNESGGLTGDSIIGEVRKLFGIYSGRVRQETGNPDSPYIMTKFGIVWSAEVINEILNSPTEGCIIR